MKKHGFTLIELLAVITILAIISLIAVPMVLNYIEKSKEEGNLISANNVQKAAELYYYNQKLANHTDKPLEILFPDEENVLNLKGNKPSAGYVLILPSGETDIQIEYDGVCYGKEWMDADIIELEFDCSQRSLIIANSDWAIEAGEIIGHNSDKALEPVSHLFYMMSINSIISMSFLDPEYSSLLGESGYVFSDLPRNTTNFDDFYKQLVPLLEADSSGFSSLWKMIPTTIKKEWRKYYSDLKSKFPNHDASIYDLISYTGSQLSRYPNTWWLSFFSLLGFMEQEYSNLLSADMYALYVLKYYYVTDYMDEETTAMISQIKPDAPTDVDEFVGYALDLLLGEEETTVDINNLSPEVLNEYTNLKKFLNKKYSNSTVVTELEYDTLIADNLYQFLYTNFIMFGFNTVLEKLELELDENQLLRYLKKRVIVPSWYEENGVLKPIKVLNSKFHLRLSGSMIYTSIDEVVISPGIEVIKEASGQGASSFKEIVFPRTVIEIGDSAFYSSGLTSLKLPSNLETIGKQAFKNNKFAMVIIPASVISIGDSAFSMASLNKVILKGKNTQLGIDWNCYEAMCATVE